MSQKGRENTSAVIGALAAFGTGYLNAKNKQWEKDREKQELEAVDRDVNEAIKKMPENMSPTQQMQYLGQQRSPVREALTKIMHHLPKKGSVREEIAPQQLFTNIVKKTLGSNPGESEIARADEVMKIGGALLQKGENPVDAYNKATEFVREKKDAKNVLQKQIVGPSLFSEKGLKNDLSKVKQIKKKGVLEDDEIALKLIEKGYGPADLDKFGLEISPELAEELGILEGEALAATQQAKKQLTEQDFNRFMQAAGGNPDMAAELALKEGFDIEAQ